MLERIFVTDYFKNPFIYWNVFIFILTTFNAHPTSVSILKIIIVNQLYVPILYGLFATLLFLGFYPIHKSISKLYHDHNLKIQALLYFGLIGGALFVHAQFFLVDPPYIFSKLEPRVVTNQQVFDEAIDLKMLSEYLGIPLLYAFSTTVVKYGLLQKQLEIKDEIRNNSRLGILAIALGIFAYLSHIIQQNFWQ